MTRNFAPFGIMALGMTVVIITGGIDLSVGSVMGLVAIVAGLFLTWQYPWYVAFAMGMLTGLACGAVNGFFVAYVGMPSFVVTLGMLSIARSLAVVFSGQPDALQVRARRADRQGDRPGEVAAARAGRLGAALDAGTLVAFLDHGDPGPDRRLRLQLHGLGAASLRHRRQ